ncbi:ketopantoate reductase family protein [Pseudonocardia sp. HH130630-07]|uniref:ketopantoate reductase family protein n=1 Tax=Pseudonocardia sp. HH130630-07 TaxID=1690815 RepID=UPI000814C6AE|nr:2-dehydropantoate 2-reductase N-terminal domain-containing protein [Pseudonocardia sp. HH130630-07]ANY06742.1 ketopantoate reductase [Pseudonocardia sp. HH130630-07]
MKILMFGRGVIASVYGHVLERAGHEVEYYVRPGRAAAYGSTIDVELTDLRSRPWGQRVVGRWPVHCREELDADHDFELIVLSVGHHQLAGAAAFLAPRIGDATVLVFGNVWAEPLVAIGDLPADRVAWGFPQAGGGIGSDGVLRAALMRPVLFGTLDGPATARELAVRRTFREAGLTIREQPDFRGWLWLHVISDAGLFSQALRRGTMADLVGAPGALREAMLVARELLPLVERRGVDLGRHRRTLLRFRAPVWLTGSALALVTAVVPLARRNVEAHDDPAAEEPRAVCRDVLAEARRLGVATPRLDAAEPHFAPTRTR